MDKTLRTAIAWAITYHYRKDIGGCACGWSKLGASYPEHVIDVALASLGLLERE